MNENDILKDFFGGSGSEVNIIPVMNIESPSSDLKEVELPEVLPILPLRNAILQKLLLHLSAASCQITFFPNGTAKVVIILTKQTFFRFFFKKRQNNLG